MTVERFEPPLVMARLGTTPESHPHLWEDAQPWIPAMVWVCDECGWRSEDRPPYALCCSTKPHTNYKMTKHIA